MGGNIRHLWYLISLFEIYIISHLIDKFLYSHKSYKVILFILILSLIYRYSIQFNFLQLKMTLSHLPYFIIGYYVGIDSLHIRMSRVHVITLFTVGLVTWAIKYHLPVCTVFVTDYIVAISLIIVAFHLPQYLPHSGFLYNMLLENAMGIYLWHVIILYIAYYYDLFASMGVYIQVCLMLIISLTISIILTLISRKLHFTFLLGESK